MNEKIAPGEPVVVQLFQASGQWQGTPGACRPTDVLRRSSNVLAGALADVAAIAQRQRG
jgi:hypothetical protein